MISVVGLQSMKGKNQKMVEKSTYEELEKKIKELEGALNLNNSTKKDLKRRYSLESNLINSSVDGIIAVDKEGNIFLFNKGAEETLGYSMQDVIGKMNIEELYLPGMARDVNKKLWSQEFGGYERIKEYETEILHKNGNHIPVSISGSLLFEKGEAIGSVGYFHDITTKKQVMEKLRESEEKYRTILEGIEDAYYEVDLNGSFTFFNDSLCKILGYSRDELTGKTNRDTMGEDQFRRLFKVTKKIYETKIPETIADWEIIRKDGEKIAIEGSISLIEDSQARATGFRGIMKDVTDKKKALAEISTLATLVKQANESIVVTDLNGDIVYANLFFEKATGYNVKEVLGQNPRVLKSGLQNDSFYKELWDTISSGIIWRGVFINKKKDGSLYHEDASIFPIIDSSGKIVNYAAVKKDITRQVKYEEALKKAKLDAESSSIAKSRFLATMSHEIRTPMNGVIGFTDMLLDTELNEDQVDYSKTIKRSGEALLSLINDVLDFSKIEAGQMELESISFDPEVTAYDVCELIRPRIGNRPVETLCRIGDEVPAYIKGDPGRYRQALINIIGNSTKFTESGEIELSLYIEKEEENRIKLHSMIRDTGIGIAEDKLESIFRPFEQADGSTTRKYGGTGLGLSICKQISNLMGGDVWAESLAGGNWKLETGNSEPIWNNEQPATSNQPPGSIFHFTAWFEKSDEKPPAAITPVSLKGVKVLVVDDNRTNLDILIHVLKTAGMNPVDLSDARDVEDTLKKQHFDICILDIQMPYIDGYDLAKSIRNSSQIPLLAFSSSTERGAKRCMEAGFNGFLPKPIRRKKLLHMIERLLGEEKDTPKKKIVTQYSIREETKHSVNILLAEDNPVNQKLAKLMLTKAGYQVEVANNGKEALNIYKEKPEDFNLIFMDIQMPEMDGMEATKEIRKLENRNLSEQSGDPIWSGEEAGKLNETEHRATSTKQPVTRIPIIAMTANAMEGDRERCIESGMDDYISKPIKREIVFEMIGRWVMEGIN